MTSLLLASRSSRRSRTVAHVEGVAGPGPVSGESPARRWRSNRMSAYCSRMACSSPKLTAAVRAEICRAFVEFRPRAGRVLRPGCSRSRVPLLNATDLRPELTRSICSTMRRSSASAAVQAQDCARCLLGDQSAHPLVGRRQFAFVDPAAHRHVVARVRRSRRCRWGWRRELSSKLATMRASSSRERRASAACGRGPG